MKRVPPRVWSDEIRKRLHVDLPLPIVSHTVPKIHFHIWVERGWSGALSPSLPGTEDVNEELRALLAELGGPEIRGNTSFPFTGLFIHVPDSEHPDADQGQWLNVSVRQCDGRPAGSHRCNSTEAWL